MKVVHLPPGIVRLLNALHRGEDPESALGDFENDMATARQWLQFTSSFYIDEWEERALANLAHLLDQVDGLPRDADDLLSRLSPLVCEAFALMERVGHGRNRSQFAGPPAVNDFLLAGAAFLAGRGEVRAILDRLEIVRTWLDHAAALSLPLAQLMEPGLQHETRRSVESLRHALQRIEEAVAADDRESLRQDLVRVHEDAAVLGMVEGWWEAERDRQARQSRYRIPLISANFEMAVEGARSLPRAVWPQGVHLLRQNILPLLECFWSSLRNVVMLPAESRDATIGAVDAGIEGVQVALEIVLNEDVPGEVALSAVEVSLQVLDDAFDRLEHASLRPRRLEGTPAGTYFDTIAGAWGGTVADAALEEILKMVPPPPSWCEVGAHIARYLEDRDPLALCDAAEALLSAPNIEWPDLPVTIPMAA